MKILTNIRTMAKAQDKTISSPLESVAVHEIIVLCCSWEKKEAQESIFGNGVLDIVSGISTIALYSFKSKINNKFKE